MRIALIAVICLIVFVSINSLSSPSHFKALPTDNFLQGTFEIVSSSDSTLNNLKTKLTFNNNKLLFKECNYYRCSYHVEHEKFSIKHCLSTKMFCPNSKQYDLTKFLNSVRTWVNEGDIYNLTNAHGITLHLKFTKKEK